MKARTIYYLLILLFICYCNDGNETNDNNSSRYDSVDDLNLSNSSTNSKQINPPIPNPNPKPANPPNPKPANPSNPKPTSDDPTPPINTSTQIQKEGDDQKSNLKNNKNLKFKFGKYHQQNNPHTLKVFIEEKNIPLNTIKYSITNATPKRDRINIRYKGWNTLIQNSSKSDNLEANMDGKIELLKISYKNKKLENAGMAIKNRKILIDIDKLNNIPTEKIEIQTNEEGKIISLNRKKFGKGNGVCTFAAAEFLVQAKEDIDPLSLDPDDIVNKALQKYKDLAPENFRKSEATEITVTLKLLNLKIKNENPKELGNKQQLLNAFKDIQERAVKENKLIKANIRNGLESWGMLCNGQGKFYIFDSHGKKSVGDFLKSFIGKFDDYKETTDFCYKYSIIKAKIDKNEQVQLIHQIYIYETS
ncbi:MAG: hypothetical protein GY830_05990 [Bacteroidetes bacterium]|nr:hypothetical protein [Bacteroidota bacterium]